MKTENNLKMALFGIQDHLAVHQTGGRIGSADGPEAFRKSFFRFKSKNDVFSKIDDLGNIRPSQTDIKKNHIRVISEIESIHAKYQSSIIVGGSHDHGYTHLKGIKNAIGKDQSIGCINIDAHFDLRKPDPEISSGSPFYLAIEDGCLDPKNFIEYGIQRHCNGPLLWNYAKEHKIQTILMDEIRDGKAISLFESCLKKLSSQCDKVVISFDLDAIASSYAPGVSAPQAEGLSASEAIQIAELSAKNQKVCSFGIFELNPIHDTDQKTQILASTMAFHFAMERLGN